MNLQNTKQLIKFVKGTKGPIFAEIHGAMGVTLIKLNKTDIVNSLVFKLNEGQIQVDLCLVRLEFGDWILTNVPT